MRYPVNVEETHGSYVATIGHPNNSFQGACEGASAAIAVAEAENLLVAMISAAMIHGNRIPAPEECHTGNAWAYITPTIAIKAGIYNAMLSDRIRKAELARRMNVDQKQVDRILDPHHASTLNQLVIAAQGLGRHIDVKLIS